MANSIAPDISFEFFPPRTKKGAAKLIATANTLCKLNPEYFSVTFGAGGSTRTQTFDTAISLQQTGFPVAPHISCIGADKANIAKQLQVYQQSGINRLVALRGDLPSGMVSTGVFQYASELVEYIRETTADHFHIEVACYPEFHPEAVNAFEDIQQFINKAKAGANRAITQYFYNIDGFYRLKEDIQTANLDIPIIPGIMPITNYENLVRFSDRCGAEIPRWIKGRLAAYQDNPEDVYAFGLEVVTRLCERLLAQGVPGLHFYTLNEAKATIDICNNLNILKSKQYESSTKSLSPIPA